MCCGPLRINPLSCLAESYVYGYPPVMRRDSYYDDRWRMGKLVACISRTSSERDSLDDDPDEMSIVRTLGVSAICWDSTASRGVGR